MMALPFTYNLRVRWITQLTAVSQEDVAILHEDNSVWMMVSGIPIVAPRRSICCRSYHDGTALVVSLMILIQYQAVQYGVGTSSNAPSEKVV